MAYRINIKHNIEGVSMDLHLKYESNDNFPEIPITLTDQPQTIQLVGWEPGDEGLDIEKIKIREPQYEINDKIYVIESVGINIGKGAYTSDQEVIDEAMNEEVSIDTSVQSNQEAIIAEFNSSYSTGNYNTAIGQLICEDESKHLYDITYSIRNTTYNSTHYPNDDDFAAEYGTIMKGAFLGQRTPSGYKGRITYGSIYFNSILLEANSQYARFQTWEKAIVGSQSINEEGRKNGSASYGLLRREYRLCTIDIRIPDKTDTIVNVYDGPDENADVLSITFAPDYTESSTSFRPCKGNIYVDGVKILSNDTFVRVRLEKGRQYVITADGISFMSMTDWQTLGNHYVTMPLYSDNILKIVVFNDNHNHGIYSDVYNQAKQNKWGLPDSLFTSN